ncbi:hypothetical protein CMV_016767 [Castanea mollissima]|uniref:Uncharacterized protein n=1 Tax=Castanea mollissima TaxID=60419 RepID=A0A8J4VJ27_9ROSI|nr:hypothetical protein CMV_016767 [Castanea mollissima]
MWLENSSPSVHKFYNQPLICIYVKLKAMKYRLWYCVSHSTYSLEHLVKHILNWWELISNAPRAMIGNQVGDQMKLASVFGGRSIPSKTGTSQTLDAISYNKQKPKTTSKRYCSVVPPWFNAFYYCLFLMDDDEEEDQ